MSSVAFNHVTYKNVFRFAFLTATITYILGLFIDVINVDAAQYASISKEMLQSGSYLIVKHCGEDYLDKPPLLFWLSALFFKIFGIHNWSYKLPSYLFTLLGVFSTYKLATSLYDKQVGKLSALILYTCQAFFMFNNDVRTDTLLAACVITATWMLYEFSQQNKWYWLLGGFLFVALGMMAKGPIGAVAPALAIGSHLLLKKDWKKLFNWKWLLGIPVVLVLLLPMCWGLYIQHGWKGVEFFFWTQSFGRITGENVWRNDAGYFFFVHTFLWSFLPWSLFAIYALVDSLVAFIKRKTLPEYISLFGFLLTFVALSLSKYKLPHYIFVVFPLIAILTAEIIEIRIVKQPIVLKWFTRIHFILFLVYSIATALLFYVFPVTNLWLPTIAVALLFSAAYLYYLKIFDGLVIPLAIAAIALNFALNIHFYPALLAYQPAKQAANILLQESNAEDKIYFYERKSPAFDFYFRSTNVYPLFGNDLTNTIIEKGSWIYSEQPYFIDKLKESGIAFTEIKELQIYPVQFLKIQFLNPSTRNKTIKKAYIVKI